MNGELEPTEQEHLSQSSTFLPLSQSEVSILCIRASDWSELKFLNLKKSETSGSPTIVEISIPLDSVFTFFG